MLGPCPCPVLGLSCPAREMDSSQTRPPTTQGWRARPLAGNPLPGVGLFLAGRVGVSALVSAWCFWHILTDRVPLPSRASSTLGAQTKSCARALPPSAAQGDTRWKGPLSSHPSFASGGLQATHNWARSRLGVGGGLTSIYKGELSARLPSPHALCGFHGNEHKSPSPSQRSLVCFARSIALETKSQSWAPKYPGQPSPLPNLIRSTGPGWGPAHSSSSGPG